MATSTLAPPTKRPFKPITLLFVASCFSVLSFYAGVYTGIKVGSSSCGENPGLKGALDASSRSAAVSSSAVGGVTGPGSGVNSASGGGCTPQCLAEIKMQDGELQRRVEQLAKEKVQEEMKKNMMEMDKLTGSACLERAQKTHDVRSSTSNDDKLFKESLKHFATGMVRIEKDDMMKTFDFGLPPNPDTEGLDALIIYNREQAMPNGVNPNSHDLPLVSATKATENCQTMNVVFTNNPGPTNQCLALIGSQYQSYHVHRYMRRDIHGGVKDNMPLVVTSRGLTKGGKVEFPPPTPQEVLDHQRELKNYLNNIDDIRARLKAKLDKMGARTVVVLTCNHGQSELLINFVCSSQARGFDLKNVLVFPTDIETKHLAEGMGLNTFYEESIMSGIPEREANFYGDVIFRKVMFAKVLCVQLVNELSHDLLFMDVDIVWFKNPLEYFEDPNLQKFDIYFQDDGSRQERYAPYSANSGFYYVRQNGRTKHLFRHLLYSGDLINAWYSHQQVLIALLAEYSSLFGLSVKILAKEMEEFPGGVQYHRKNDEMKRIMSGQSNAIIFHMSWTTNKDNKLKFFQQMGEWYVHDICIGKKISEIEKPDEADGALIQPCCSAEPLIKCHYKDKPSKIPCKDSPAIDKNGKSFW